MRHPLRPARGARQRRQAKATSYHLYHLYHLALAGGALFFQSSALAGYALLFMHLAHVFVWSYEEPTLRRTFGDEYETYCRSVGRWLPKLRKRNPNATTG